MERAEGCCSAVYGAQLCTLALASKGAEALLRSQRERETDFLHSLRAASA